MSAATWSPERVYVGTCAWSYDDWREVFYPHEVPRNHWLEFYAKHFPAVEMDSSFHHVPSGQNVAHWCAMTGEGFRFCPKVPRTLSHERRLEDPAPEINMMGHLADELGERFGCALLQLPPSFHAGSATEKSLRHFLRQWPRDFPLAIEFRHESWETPHAAHLLEAHQVAWVWSDRWPLGEEKHAGFGFLPVTAPHLYVRLLGDERTKLGADGREQHDYRALRWPRDVALDHWTLKLRHHADAAAIYVFANNHYEGMGVRTAQRLASKFGLELPAAAETSPAQLELFDQTRES